MNFFFNFYYPILLNEAFDAKTYFHNLHFFILDCLDEVPLTLKHCMANPPSKISLELKFLVKV